MNPESNICLSLGSQTSKTTKQQQKQMKTSSLSFFQLVAGIWGLKPCICFCRCWKRFGSAHVSKSAFNIQVLGGKWFAIRNLLFNPSHSPKGANAELGVRMQRGMGASWGSWGLQAGQNLSGWAHPTTPAQEWESSGHGASLWGEGGTSAHGQTWLSGAHGWAGASVTSGPAIV